MTIITDPAEIAYWRNLNAAALALRAKYAPDLVAPAPAASATPDPSTPAAQVEMGDTRIATADTRREEHAA